MSVPSATAMSRSAQLRDEGNRHFKSGDYASADSLYSNAILADPKNPTLYTNRAMARIQLAMWDSVVADCHACLALSPSSIKAHYCLSQAQLAIRDYDAAIQSARRAHDLCAATNDKSLAAVTAIVLRCKKERWDHRERKRVREAHDLERDLLDLLDRQRDDALAAEQDQVEADVIRHETLEKTALLRDVFDRARSQSDQPRQVPEWAIDDISFAFMVDPVVTKTGKSYERASILEHLRRHQTDPLTREPLTASELRPNVSLRQACDEFLDRNGWAADW